MNDERKKRREEVFRLKQSLVDDLMSLSDAQILKQAGDDGINADETRSRVLSAFQSAQQVVGARRLKDARQQLSASSKVKPTVLTIDAAKARDILKRVAARPRSNGPPLLMAARLEGATEDSEVLEIVSALNEMGLLSDDELK